MIQSEKAVDQEQTAKRKEAIVQHKGCGGELRRLNQELVMAGKPGNYYIIYQCLKCEEIIVVG